MHLALPVRSTAEMAGSRLVYRGEYVQSGRTPSSLVDDARQEYPISVRSPLYLALAFAACLAGACTPAPDTGAPVLPVAATTDAVICLVGDIGTGKRGERLIATTLQQLGCTQVRLLGDLVYPKGIRDASDGNLRSHFLEPYRELLAAHIPLYLALGNHDYGGNPGAWLDVARREPGLHMPARFYAEQWDDGLCVITLDTNWYERLDLWRWRATQTGWLRKALSALQGSCTLSVALGHHPLYGSGEHGNAKWQTAIFLRDEISGKVDAYIAGHEHLLGDEGRIDGTRWLVSGAGARNDGIQHRNAAASYLSGELGVLVLKPVRHGPRVRQAAYEFWEVPRTGQSGPLLAHRGVIDGNGIRD